MDRVAEIDRARKLISCEGSGARIPFCLEPREISLSVDGLDNKGFDAVQNICLWR